MSYTFHTRVAGVTFKNKDGSSRQKIIKNNCEVGQMVDLIHEEDNQYGKNAIKICLQTGESIGYIPNTASCNILKDFEKFDFYSLISHKGFYKVHYLEICLIAVEKNSSEEFVQNLVEKEFNQILKTNELKRQRELDFAAKKIQGDLWKRY
jgi:hypothetical protein